MKLGAATIGFLQTGQVMRHKPTAVSFQRAVVQAQKLGVNIDNAETKLAYFATPVVPPKKLDCLSRLLAIFADHLSMKSNLLLLNTEAAELPVIAKAKQFIQEHHTEDISLGQVASAVHISPCYFCKLFRSNTGLKFTDFLSRTRVEKAKNLLLDSRRRVSEIGFDVGFQSLSHFSRMFKKIARQSPTEYRAALLSKV